MQRVQLTTTYPVADKGVTLSIVIGDAQIGSSLVLLEDKEIGRGSIRDLAVGAGATLKGRKLFVKSVVTDVNDQTNHTSITYLLKGGVSNTDLHQTATVDDEGDSVIYRATIAFV